MSARARIMEEFSQIVEAFVKLKTFDSFIICGIIHFYWRYESSNIDKRELRMSDRRKFFRQIQVILIFTFFLIFCSLTDTSYQKKSSYCLLDENLNKCIIDFIKHICLSNTNQYSICFATPKTQSQNILDNISPFAR